MKVPVTFSIPEEMDHQIELAVVHKRFRNKSAVAIAAIKMLFLSLENEQARTHLNEDSRLENKKVATP